MTPSRPKRKRLAVVIGPCVLGLLLVPFGQHPASASPPTDLAAQPRRPALNLRLDSRAATRVLAELSGAAQESDTEKPRSMEAQAVTPPPSASAAAKVKKEPPPPDSFAFLKDWPFWVIVGGVVIAGVGGYMLLRNSNQKAPCAPQFTAGCFP